MSREIKFRAWDGIQMWRSFELNRDRFVYPPEVTNPPEKNLDFMQYTGLQDKNGVEIYEGDVIEKIKWDRPYSKSQKPCRVRSAVEWDEQTHQDNPYNNEILENDPSAFHRTPGFRAREIWNEKGYGNHNWSDFAQCEVIGNIYENPELLTGGAS